MNYLNKRLLSALLILGIAISGCDKTKLYDIKEAESQAHFNGAKTQQYNITTNPPPAYNIVIGTTDVSDQDRVITFNVTSPSGAVAGTEYTLGITGTTVTIPAGQATATIPVTGNFNSFNAGQKDTLVFTLKEPSVKVAGFLDTVNLVLRGPCFDGVDINDAANRTATLGDYNNSNDDGFGPYGPYQTKLKSITLLTATTARAVINNVWDFGFGDINFIIDWTTSSNVTINVEGTVVTGADAGVLNPAYNGMNLVIRKHPSANGNYSVCTGTHTLRYQLGVYNPATSSILGYFGAIGITVMNR
jgi:hypothetical protein